ncbi:MAG TPA: alginate lyase family protein, partial [Caldimonas sp.]|nr:alginate lyase family protein [Caldimonas sp.]
MPWIVDLLLALDRQLSHIEQNLSYYFSPNTHLLGEALALYVCGRALPLLQRSPDREAAGRRVLLDEARRQIAADGGHCERSTHYHRYTLDFYLLALTIARITDDPAAPDFERTAVLLADAARVLADDRGELPLIGDDDGGMLFPIAGRAPADIRDSLTVAAALLGRPHLRVGPPPEEAYWLLAHPSLARALDTTPSATRGPVRSAALRDTGYYVARSKRGDHLVIDGGMHGYLNGGHAHADALSLTLTVAGVPLLVDPGTGAYTIDQALRDRLRSSQMHNTLVVDGRSQSIGKGPFSWKTMARSRVRTWTTHPAFDYFEGTHDGYWPIEHRRHVLAVHGDLLVVADLVTGDGTHTASVHWHVDP